MHCKFEDLESGRILEVDLALGQDGKVSKQDVKEKDEEMAAVGKSKVQ
jgi:hypothetical protein